VFDNEVHGLDLGADELLDPVEFLLKRLVSLEIPGHRRLLSQ
jgi:hypothetical protein